MRRLLRWGGGLVLGRRNESEGFVWYYEGLGAIVQLELGSGVVSLRSISEQGFRR